MATSVKALASPKKISAIWPILAIAFLLRLIGVQFGLPYLYHADEPIVVNHALAYGGGDFNPHFFKIPPLISYVLFFIYGIAYLIGRGGGILSGVSDLQNLFFRDPSFFYLIGRILLGVFLGTLSVWLFYRLIRKYFSEESALWASFFLAICFLHVRDSHFIYTDIPLIFVFIACFFPILKIAEGNTSILLHIGSGLLMGLATAVKYNGIVIVIPYIVATLISHKRNKIFLSWIAADLAAVLIYSVLNPYTWLDFTTFWKEISMQASASGYTGWFHHLVYSLTGGIGPGLLLAGIIGIAMTVIKYDSKKLIFISFILAYYLLLVFRSQHYDRYVLPLIPFILFFAGDFFSKFTPRILKLFLIVLVSIPPFAKSVLGDILLVKSDIRTMAKDWVEEAIPSGSKIALDWSFFEPRLAPTKSQLEEKLALIDSRPHFSRAQRRRLEFLYRGANASDKRYEIYFLAEKPTESGFLLESPQVSYSVDELNQKGIEYVFIARTQREHPQAVFYKQIRERGELMKRFSPYRDPAMEYPIDRLALTGVPFLWAELLKRERNGQPIEVYRLK